MNLQPGMNSHKRRYLTSGVKNDSIECCIFVFLLDWQKKTGPEPILVAKLRMDSLCFW